MQASELRIGNHVNYCNEKCVLDAELFKGQPCTLTEFFEQFKKK